MEELKNQFSQAIRRDFTRTQRRSKSLRLAGISVISLIAFSGTAIAAGNLTGVIDLGGGVQAEEIEKSQADPSLQRESEVKHFYKLRGTKDGLGVQLGTSEPITQNPNKTYDRIEVQLDKAHPDPNKVKIEQKPNK